MEAEAFEVLLEWWWAVESRGPEKNHFAHQNSHTDFLGFHSSYRVGSLRLTVYFMTRSHRQSWVLLWAEWPCLLQLHNPGIEAAGRVSVWLRKYRIKASWDKEAYRDSSVTFIRRLFLEMLLHFFKLTPPDFYFCNLIASEKLCWFSCRSNRALFHND